MKVKVYSTQWCVYCKLVKDFLKQNNVKFEEFDVGEDRKAATEMLLASGQEGVPVTDVDGKIVIGFDKEKLKKLLKL